MLVLELAEGIFDCGGIITIYLCMWQRVVVLLPYSWSSRLIANDTLLFRFLSSSVSAKSEAVSIIFLSLEVDSKWYLALPFLSSSLVQEVKRISVIYLSLEVNWKRNLVLSFFRSKVSAKSKAINIIFLSLEVDCKMITLLFCFLAAVLVQRVKQVASSSWAFFSTSSSLI